MINGRAVVVMEGEVLVPVVISFLVRIIGVVQREETGQVKVFGRCLMLKKMREEDRQFHQVRTHQEPLDPEDRKKGPQTSLHDVKVGAGLLRKLRIVMLFQPAPS